MEIPEGDLMISFLFGVSNMGSDWDNPVKPAQDVIAKYYGFNDSRIIEGRARKVKVPKGQEFIEFKIEQDKPIKDVKVIRKSEGIYKLTINPDGTWT